MSCPLPWCWRGRGHQGGPRRFAGDYARQEEGWQSVEDPDWPLPCPAAPGMVLAAAPEALGQFLGARLRRARLVTLNDDAERRRRAIARLRQIYGDIWTSGDQTEPAEHREVILLLTPDCQRDAAADRTWFARRAGAILRNHPDALVLPPPTSGAMPLAALLRQVEAVRDHAPDDPQPGTPIQVDAPDNVTLGGGADDPDTDEPGPKPF